MSSHYRYYLFNKPYGVLSQFTKEVESHVTLADYMDLPTDVYPVGRLDKDSEGLLLLTNDNSLKTKLLDPNSKKSKTYLVQLDGDITETALMQLSKGVTINIKKKNYKTLPASVEKVDPPLLPSRVPPVRYRAAIPTSWIKISIHEGKNRQIRRMCAAVDFPVLRLIRIGIGLLAKQLPVGDVQELSSDELKLMQQ